MDRFRVVTTAALVLGVLRAEGYSIYRSAIRWLVPSGSRCRAGEVFAYCTLSLVPDRGRPQFRTMFGDEELQVAFASWSGGRIAAAGEARGGALRVRSVEAWDPQEIIAHLEDGAGTMTLRLLVLAAQRLSTLANNDVGLLPGWLERRRGWWCDAGEVPVTVLCLGLCDATGVIAGEQNAFVELFESEIPATHCVSMNDRPLAFAAPVLLDQLERTPARFEAIAADLHRAIGTSSVVPTASDWVLCGALLASLRRSPIPDRYTLLTPAGTLQTKPADLVVLSLSSEPQAILRHKSLHYHVHVMSHHQDEGGPAFRAWLAGAFEPVRRSIDDIRRDYERLVDAVAKVSGARLAIVNRMSTLGHEDISSYSAFDSPMGETLSIIAAKEQNLMLHDLSDTHDVAIIDLDALAAEFGGAEHVPDGIHQSGPIQTALRAELSGLLGEVRRQVTSNATAILSDA